MLQSHSLLCKVEYFISWLEALTLKISLNHSMKRQRLISEQGAHLGDKPDGEGKEDLKQKHVELAKKVLEVRNKVHNAETEVKTLQKEILDAGLKLLHNNNL